MAEPSKRRFRWAWTGGLLATAAAVSGVYFDRPAEAQIAVRNQGYVPYSDAPINYRTRELTDPVALLEKQIEAGKVHLTYEKDHGYLKSVMRLLKVPENSQTLVFSKTSFQYPKISPDHPRALYYNDDVYVGAVHDGKAIEIVSFDPMQGAIFYLLDEQKVDKPVFQRAELDCTQCHIAPATRGIPGVFVRSVHPTAIGGLGGGSTFVTDQKSALKDRWGGWYVNGSLAASTMGNAILGDVTPAADGKTKAPELKPLEPAFDKAAYLVPGSDQVALLVLAHQTQMHNLITLTNYQTRLALYDLAKEATGATSEEAAQIASVATPALDDLPEATRKQITTPADQLVRYLLFSNETSLGGLDAKKTLADSPYARTFQAQGVRDSKRRSLRDFDLHDRIFRYPCSYLIYSSAFDAIPDPAKGYIYHRLLQVLSGQDQSPEFANLSAQDRQAILSILLETKPSLPAEWRDYARSNHLQVAALPSRSSLN
ncbi:MAG: hypothetical protein WDN45_15955 [Caulobacteraceae bacterium]